MPDSGCTRGDLALELGLVDYDRAGIPFFVVRSDDGAVAISVSATSSDGPRR